MNIKMSRKEAEKDKQLETSSRKELQLSQALTDKWKVPSEEEVIENTEEGERNENREEPYEDGKITGKGWAIYKVSELEYIDVLRITRGGPWSILSVSISVKRWSLNAIPGYAPFHLVPFWVRIYNVPEIKFNQLDGRYMGDAIGSCMQIDEDKTIFDNRGYSFRVRVMFDIRKNEIFKCHQMLYGSK